MEQYQDTSRHTQFFSRPQSTPEERPGVSIAPTRPDGLAGFGGSQIVPPQRATILVVDDERLIADTLVHILNLSGFTAHAVYSGQAAIDALPTLCPETVLTDVRMPGKDGIETGIEIRKRCPHTRVVLFSGQAATDEIIDKARQDGHGFELWPKPIHPRELVKRLRALSSISLSM